MPVSATAPAARGLVFGQGHVTVKIRMIDPVQQILIGGIDLGMQRERPEQRFDLAVDQGLEPVPLQQFNRLVETVALPADGLDDQAPAPEQLQSFPDCRTGNG